MEGTKLLLLFLNKDKQRTRNEEVLGESSQTTKRNRVARTMTVQRQTTMDHSKPWTRQSNSWDQKRRNMPLDVENSERSGAQITQHRRIKIAKCLLQQKEMVMLRIRPYASMVEIQMSCICPTHYTTFAF